MDRIDPIGPREPDVARVDPVRPRQVLREERERRRREQERRERERREAERQAPPEDPDDDGRPHVDVRA
jgi:hypothetical protein